MLALYHSVVYVLLLLVVELQVAQSFAPSLLSFKQSPTEQIDQRALVLSATAREDPSSASPSSSWDSPGGSSESGRVVVRVQRTVKGCSFSPSAAVDTWLEQHWKKGGGLPIYVLTNEEDETQSKRTLLPVGMEEKYMHQDVSEEEEEEGGTLSATITYTVSKSGPIFADLVPNSHKGTVKFVQSPNNNNGNNNNLTMTWHVEFETTRLQPLYQGFTEFTIGVAARTVAEALAPSRVLKVQAPLPVTNKNDDYDKPTIMSNQTMSAARYALREWLEFFWARGGGLPLPPPIPFGPVLEQGGGSARASILRVPPLLVDTVLSVRNSDGDGAAMVVEAIYQIENPGWTTFPFLIHTHLGRVRFQQSTMDEAAVDITWEIQVRPFPLVAPLVETLLEMTATTIVRNLAVHMMEPDAQVMLRPPRGQAIDLGGDDTTTTTTITTLGSVPKASWLGGVLDEHIKDQRSTVEQTLSLLQPWTWGRAKDAGSEQDTVQVRWTTGDMEP